MINTRVLGLSLVAISILALSACNNSENSTSLHTITHNGDRYETITSPYTGKIWLDRNLGANRVCLSLDDEECYGDYYQWGRDTDGHEDKISDTTSILATDINSAGLSFITSLSDYDYDWEKDIDFDGDLRAWNWSKTDGSSACPTGFRVPTVDEIKAETMDIGVDNNNDIFNNFLKLPSAGYRGYYSGTMHFQGSYGSIWSSEVNGSYSHYMQFNSSLVSTYYSRRADGRSVRCLKD